MDGMKKDGRERGRGDDIEDGIEDGIGKEIEDGGRLESHDCNDS